MGMIFDFLLRSAHLFQLLISSYSLLELSISDRIIMTSILNSDGNIISSKARN